MKPLPRPLLSYYGDDFTGSTDAMEVLSSNGVATLLFLRTPSADEIALAKQTYPAIGIAGISRSKDVAWLDQHLPDVFTRLKQADAAICHYKVCSTFDSSPTIGNIGRAIEIGRGVFGSHTATPLVVGTPALRRYTLFGHLFASVGNMHHRIDRHPTMSRHPVTPMDEADLRLHLARQTALRVGLFDAITQQRPDAAAQLAAELQANDIVLFDVLDDASLARVGKQVWALAEARANDGASSLFCAGSSGLEYALVSHWRTAAMDDVAPTVWSAGPVRQIAVVSGSCSPVTAAQIEQAETDGFHCLRADPIRLLEQASRTGELQRLGSAALRALQDGASVVIYTARGPGDAALEQVNTYIKTRQLDYADAMAGVGDALGILLRELIADGGLQRVVVAGGDTSGQVMQALNLSALKMRAMLAPGAPLCAGFSAIDHAPTIEIALKGGQVGNRRYFSSVLAGRLLVD
ncbi:MAG: four-carbon acid sugar kinase family protein [Oxalobacteraceae bacterium]|nr:four-carbon acid sugar kinase family protein [Oxalobacteraceae bacterium]